MCSYDRINKDEEANWSHKSDLVHLVSISNIKNYSVVYVTNYRTDGGHYI